MKFICTITKIYNSIDYPDMKDERDAKDQFIEDVSESNFDIDVETEN